METSVVESKLSDGSSVFAVVFVDGSEKAVIGALDENSAYRLQTAFKLNAAFATIETHRPAA